ncbi:hypothetical protein C8A03DRAFT_12804 [Achaetomium macrosporum]|uniref:Prp 4 CRoW domain-containing protein n=1 Tax=Achaetomium macrosporum TaxID=79813 RepID=A0AAN7CGZ5_9PEZI|nr:hypothetical protein C8A03DRAFT_12804 [Achaetomium macrosporum]
MLVKSVAAFAALTFAASVAAEPMPYKPNMMKTSVRDLFGVVRRQDGSGYQPEQAMCGEGATCAEACGAGYTTCASGDNQVHCFNPTAGEICCPDKSGNSCDAGYYCTSDKEGETWCCPEGMDLAACAAAYSVTGGLVSQTPAPTTTSTTSSSSTAPPTTTSTSSTSSISSNSTTAAPSTSSAALTTSISITSSPSLLPSSSFVAPLNTTSLSTVVAPKPTQSSITEGAGSIVGPASALVFLAAGLAALL